jgi:uncharacterized protein YbaP (TraB family)
VRFAEKSAMSVLSYQRVFRATLVTCFACALATAAPAQTGKHCLWRVTNAPAPFYLLGSVHALRPSDYERAPVVDEAIKQSQQIYLEFDPKEEQTFAKKLNEAAKLPKGQQIKEKISPKTYDYLRKITLSGWGTWQHLRPWAVAMLLNYPRLAGVSQRYGLDTYVAGRARASGKATKRLETVDEHIRVFSDMQDIEGEVLLLQALVHADETAKRFRESVEAWKAGDVDRIYGMEAPRMKEAPTVWWRLLDHRNANWVPRIEAAIKSGKPTLVVAGAAHFAGPHSVIAMLRAQGYKIEQL